MHQFGFVGSDGSEVAMPARWSTLAALAIGAQLSSCTGPGLTGNDTGGIIPWSPDSRQFARATAAEHCARYGKVARINSVHAEHGNYISFSCRFDWRYTR